MEDKVYMVEILMADHDCWGSRTTYWKLKEDIVFGSLESIQKYFKGVCKNEIRIVSKSFIE